MVPNGLTPQTGRAHHTRMSDPLPAIAAPPRRRVNFVALGCCLLVIVFFGTSLYRTWTLTDGAILQWRLHLLLPDLLGGLPIALGCALTAFGSPRLRRVGATLAILVVLGIGVWTAGVLSQ
ncbi:MAG TPA: hypothetical protein VNU46_06155 [Gemmatimonadaceae bacterium]|jgi:hypothetical protein|nr:hypothetical protein [Gemmatimonadaceae bacterium]